MASLDSLLQIFTGVSDFASIERRIAALPEEKQRGDAFEAFVNAFLRTMPIWQVEELWPVGQIPLSVRRRLNLPDDTASVDGAFRTTTGDLVAYQTKFRIHRPKIHREDVATFLGFSDRCDDRILITNSDRFHADIVIRDGLRIIRGTDFDALTPAQIAAIVATIQHRPAALARPALRPHQRTAVGAVVASFSTRDRTTLVMACGSGKTLTGTAIAKELGAETVLVLVPSLALVGQVLRDWTEAQPWDEPFRYLAVCSDDSVTDTVDPIRMKSTDLPFHVTTDPSDVRRFLTRKADGRARVVFSTYHSAKVVAEGMPKALRFDLGIFDEAHKTVGRSAGMYAFALSDTNLRIRQRLFLTATPRVVRLGKTKDDDLQFSSMDDPNVYGPTAHTLSFGEAVDLGIICDYKVLVATVNPDEVKAHALAHGVTLVKGDQQATKWVATQIAVAKAVKKVKARKVITFHSRVSLAKTYASHTERGLGQHLKGFTFEHVNGSMAVADRQSVLAGFARDEKLLVTNARCLTEGVDLPAVDMVAFVDPKRSKIDIVQAIGRAMRKPRHGTKTLGYVVVPLLIAPHKAGDLASVEKACAKTDWEDVLTVLASLADHDSRLHDIVAAARASIGQRGTFDPRALRERVQLIGEVTELSTLARHTEAVLVDRLGSTWDERYGELVAYKATHGHTNVPAAQKPLGMWCDAQRQARKKGWAWLTPERIARLNSLNFLWQMRDNDAAWHARCAEYEAFARVHGPRGATARNSPDNLPLVHWCANTRRALAAGTLTESERADLVRIRFPDVKFVRPEEAWRQMYTQLVAFRKAHGHCDVPIDTIGPLRPLGRWVSVQRQQYCSESLSLTRIALLERLGFTWVARDNAEVFEQRFAQLMAFTKKHGHTRVRREHDQGLYTWWVSQRGKKARGQLSPEHIAKFETVPGLDWAPRDSRWTGLYNKLVAFKRAHGHLEVPSGSELWRWVQIQRTARRANRATLTADRIAKLDALGFVWTVHPPDRWERRYDELRAFVSRVGHCDVRASEGASEALVRWVMVQRYHRRTGVLSESRCAALDALGLEWNPRGGKEARLHH
jgi:superfamily II DNA or RNA helicase